MIAALPPAPPANVFVVPAALVATSPAQRFVGNLAWAQAAVTGDPLLARQSHLPQINWSRPGCARRPLVAVLDTGVDANHPDLGGVVDTVNSRSFAGGSALSDTSGHGTHMAGLIAAVGGNGRGGAGVSCARILSVKVATTTSDADSTSVAQGIRYAVSQKARVISISLGGDEPSTGERAAINRAVRAGVVVVAAAGNGGKIGNPREYPGGYPHVITVGAVNRLDVPLVTSTAGPQILLAAPGRSLWSTSPGGRYRARTGTSVAAAVVSGAAARLIAQRPTVRPEQVAELLRSTARDVGPVGRDDRTGAGVVNLRAALRAATPLRDRGEVDDDAWTVRNRTLFLPATRPDATATATLRAGYDPSDNLRIEMRAGQRITVLAAALDSFDPDLVVWKPGTPAPSAGPTFLRDWAAALAIGTGRREQLTFTARTTGPHTVEVRTIAGGGRYRITVTREPE